MKSPPPSDLLELFPSTGQDVLEYIARTFAPTPPGVAEALGRLPAGSQPIETSETAADRQSPALLARRRRQVLSLFLLAGDTGLTADEVVAAFGDGTDHNSYAPRVTELNGMGYLAKLDGKEHRDRVRRKTRKGGNAFVLVITKSGRRLLTPQSQERSA